MSLAGSLTILFDDPFWIGLYERRDGDRYEVCKITFGPEPKDCEVYEFFLRNWRELQFSPPVKAELRPERRVNPKRMQRKIGEQLRESGIGTKAQQALKLQREQNRAERRAKSREEREAEEERRYCLRREKKKGEA